MNFETGQLRAFDAAVTEGSLEGAARLLHVTPSAISQRVRALESAVGQVLLIRARPVRTTSAGQTVLRLARQVALLASDTTDELGLRAPVDRGLEAAGSVPSLTSLSIAVNADSLGTWVLTALAPLTDQLLVDIRREDEDRTRDLLRHGAVMAAITTEAHPVAGCRSVRLGVMRYRAMASKAFAARWFVDGTTVPALRRAPVVLFDRDDDLQHEWLRRRGVDVHPPTHYVPATADHVRAVSLGMGWGMVPDLPGVTAGLAPHLVDIAPADPVDRVLHWQQWRLRSGALDRAAAAVLAAAAEQLRA